MGEAASLHLTYVNKRLQHTNIPKLHLEKSKCDLYSSELSLLG